MAVTVDCSYSVGKCNSGTTGAVSNTWVYVNGSSVGSSTVPYGASSPTIYLYLGGGARVYLDEVYLFSGYLSPSQAQVLWQYDQPTCPLIDTTFCGNYMVSIPFTFATQLNDTMGTFTQVVTTASSPYYPQLTGPTWTQSWLYTPTSALEFSLSGQQSDVDAIWYSFPPHYNVYQPNTPPVDITFAAWIY